MSRKTGGLDAQAAALWPRFKADRNDRAARDALAMIYRPVLRRAVAAEMLSAGRRYRRAFACDEGDLEQIGFILLLQLLGAFDPDRNASFEGYAGAYLRLRIRGEVRGLSWLKRRAIESGIRTEVHSLDAGEGAGRDAAREVAAGDEGVGEALERADLLEWLKSRLPARLTNIFELRFLGEMTLRRAAERLARRPEDLSRLTTAELIPLLASMAEAAPGADERLRELLVAVRRGRLR